KNRAPDYTDRRAECHAPPARPGGDTEGEGAAAERPLLLGRRFPLRAGHEAADQVERQREDDQRAAVRSHALQRRQIAELHPLRLRRIVVRALQLFEFIEEACHYRV
ncbi:MAG: hypothetical protein ACXW6T_27815, partial [Candidatus Binatia bacterium]